MRNLADFELRAVPRPADAFGTVINMAAVGFRLAERVYGLDQGQAQFLAGQLQRRLLVPESAAELADKIWKQSMRCPPVV